MAVKVGYKLILTFLQLASFGFVDSKYECAFSGKEFITFSKDIIDGPLPCQYTLLRTNARDHIDSFLIETICNQRKETYEKSISVTALGKHILLSMYNITIDRIPQKKDVSIMIPPVRIDVTQTKGIKRVHLNIGITVLYTPPNTVKIAIGANYTGTHNLTGACGNPWATAKHPDNHNVNRRRLFKLIKNNPKYPQKHDSSNWAKVNPEFKRIPTPAYNNMNKPSILGHQNGVRYPQHISNKAGDMRFQKATLFPRCYFGGFLHNNGSMWMSVDCLIVFTCVNTLVTHRKISGCSEFADCIKIRQGATCRCRPGFIGTGLTCAFLQDKLAPHAPNGHFATVITPAVPAGRLVTTVGLDIKRGPSYSDWRNLIRQPLHNRHWDPQNQNDFKKKFHKNKIWRPLKRRPMLNADKPGRQSPSVRLDGFPRFSKNGLNPITRNRLNVAVPDIDNPKLVKNRQRSKNVPSHHMASRTRLDKPKNRYRTGPNIFTRLNNPNMSRKVGKPLMPNNRHFIGLNRHPLTLDKNRVIPDTMPHNKLGLYPALANQPRQIYMSCKRKNGRNICKLMPGIYKNGKTVPGADLFNINPGLRKRLIILINNKFRPHKKPKLNPVYSPNNRDRIMDDSIPEHGRGHRSRHPKPDHFPDKGTGNNAHKNKNPTIRTQSNPKQNDSSHNRPIEKVHKLTNVNQYPHKQPVPSDIKRVTEILRRVSVALNETGKKRVSANRWVLLPRSSTLFSSPITGRQTFTDFADTFTPPTTSFINPTAKDKEDDRFTTLLPTSSSHIGTLAEYTYSLEQPQLGANWRPILNDGGGVPGKQRGVVKNNPRQDVKHKYPTADGTVDGLVIDPPPEWPFQFPRAPSGYGNQKGIQQPNTGPRVNPGIRKCGAAGCGKRKNATNKGHTFLPRKYVEFVYPSSTRSSNNPSDAVSTLVTTVLYTTRKATTPEIRAEPVKEGQRINSNFEQPKMNPEMASKNVEPQPPSGAEVHANSDNCKQTKERTPLTGLRYNILKQIRQSVEQIEG